MGPVPFRVLKVCAIFPNCASSKSIVVVFAVPGGPGFQRRVLFFGQFGFGVHGQIHKHGHFPLLDLFPALFDGFRPIIGAQLVPLREVQMLAPLFDMVGHGKGNGRHPGIPGPVDLIGVAVVTGFLEDRHHVRRSLDFARHRGIRAVKGNKLAAHKQDSHGNSDSSGPLHIPTINLSGILRQ